MKLDIINHNGKDMVRLHPLDRQWIKQVVADICERAGVQAGAVAECAVTHCGSAFRTGKSSAMYVLTMARATSAKDVNIPLRQANCIFEALGMKGIGDLFPDATRGLASADIETIVSTAVEKLKAYAAVKEVVNPSKKVAKLLSLEPPAKPAPAEEGEIRQYLTSEHVMEVDINKRVHLRLKVGQVLNLSTNLDGSITIDLTNI